MKKPKTYEAMAKRHNGKIRKLKGYLRRYEVSRDCVIWHNKQIIVHKELEFEVKELTMLLKIHNRELKENLGNLRYYKYLTAIEPCIVAATHKITRNLLDKRVNEQFLVEEIMSYIL